VILFKAGQPKGI